VQVIFAYHQNQNISTLSLDFNTVDESTAPNMKYPPMLPSFPATFTTTRHPVLSVTWPSETVSWWYREHMSVPRDGLASTTGTWWQNIMITITQVSSSVWMRMHRRRQGHKKTKMAHCCNLLKEHAARCHVNHISMGMSWHVQCAPNDWRHRTKIVGVSRFIRDLLSIKLLLFPSRSDKDL